MPLHSHTELDQCEFLRETVASLGARTCLEVGLAYGISSLFLCDAIAHQPAPRYICIDPYQEKDWAGIGLANLERCGYDRFTEFHAELSHFVLPDLLRRGESIDFAYIDTTKIFDVVLVDAYYVTRLLRIGGLVAFDDCHFPSLDRLVRYLETWPHLRVRARHGADAVAPPRKMRRKGPPWRRVTTATPARCVVFEKIAEDTRPWDWDAGS